MQYAAYQLQEPFIYLRGGYTKLDKPWMQEKRTLQGFELLLPTHHAVYTRQQEMAHIVRPGEMLLLRPDLPREGYRCSDKGTCFYWLRFRSTQPVRYVSSEELAEENEKRAERQTRRSGKFSDEHEALYIPMAGQLAQRNRAFALADHLLRTAGQHSCARRAEPYLLTALLVDLAAQTTHVAITQKSDRFSPQQGLVEALQQFLQANLPCELAPKRLCEQFHYSYDYMARLFKRHTGLSLGQYLLQERLRRAEELLTQTDDSVKNIARSVGFCDERYFMRQFKQAHKLTPTVYRRVAGIPSDQIIKESQC
ncbi:helix-turn-helix transcriptional regulator [Paenibacillus sp. F411]|uniref:helix-turn-helix domain-containing protein n=1 Tax=Paenibacillus sp. F411 TaxID=2820239 RepID=UPI001AAF12F3|nr:AraC family transcriptional regulator [Paenibacillus sp. F411]MBO2945251.1 helix-turn-helix transcriptional regulator [Paenibacillus sp. F411]